MHRKMPAEPSANDESYREKAPLHSQTPRLVNNDKATSRQAELKDDKKTFSLAWSKRLVMFMEILVLKPQGAHHQWASQ
jgi:hypothetical protein